MEMNQQQLKSRRAGRKGGWLRIGLAMLAAALAGCALIAAVGSFTGFAAGKQMSKISAWHATGPASALRLNVLKAADSTEFTGWSAGVGSVTDRMRGLSAQGLAVRLNDCAEGLFADFRTFLLAAACTSLAGYGIACAAAESRDERRRKTEEQVRPTLSAQPKERFL